MSEPGLTDGERWSSAQLAELRDARFRWAAIVRFLGASARRSGEVREARPELVAQSRRWMAAGAGAWLALAAAGVEPFRSRARLGLGWWMATALMLDWHLGMVETLDGRPRRLGPADAATLARAWLVPVAATRPTALVCGLAGASDVADGLLARATAPTRAGRDLEGLVDVCFAAAALRGLRDTRALASGVVAAEVARMGAGVAYSVVEYFGRAAPPDETILRAGRATAGLRLAGLAAGAAGRRRTGTALLAAGSAGGLGAVAARIRARRRQPSG